MILAIVTLPLISALLTGLFVRSMPAKTAETLASVLLVVAAVFSGYEFYAVALMGESYTLPLATWIQSGDFSVPWALRVDPLTAVMLVVVTWVSAVVHIYSVGYMHHDPHRQRFMCYLSLFTFAMLMLVTADNFLQVFFGWEGVGLCSYLLIGFWFRKDSANAASMKAFITNRVGDFGFALGIFALYWLFGSLQFDTVFAQAPSETMTTIPLFGYDIPALELIGVLLFIGCMGKSAQFMLHVWLPDAMEGPTPVSALIHAATMVTAGVFLVARCSPLYEYAPFALSLVGVVGAITALFAATVGMVQNDIKKVIAYSTCSQLGYMFFACGVSAYSAAIFHLMTHAFFKALLFLGAGSVIHAMSDEQDMRRMGGIWRKVPVTYAYMWLGSLALMGVPYFAGFFSKDMILEVAFAAHTPVGTFAFWMGIAAALLTSFYSIRLIIMTFHGAPRASAEVMGHVHESPPVMTLPLGLLALGAVASGAVGYYLLHMVDAEGAFWGRSIFVLPQNQALEHAHHVPLWVMALPLAVAITGSFIAYLLYARSPEMPSKIAAHIKALYCFLKEKWYFDRLYNWLFVRGALRGGKSLWQSLDMQVIDRLGPNGMAFLSHRGAALLSRVQSGLVYHYAFVMLVGLILLISLLARYSFREVL